MYIYVLYSIACSSDVVVQTTEIYQPFEALLYNTIVASKSEVNKLKQVQESPAVADKPARRLRKVRTVYVRAVGL